MTAFDTNILIYICDKADRQRQRHALDLLGNTRDAVLLWQVAVEFVAASRKLASQGFTSFEAWARSREFMGVQRLILPSPKALEFAQVLHVDQGLAFWDAMIVGSCLDAGVQILYSEDLPGRAVDPKIRIVNPFM